MDIRRISSRSCSSSGSSWICCEIWLPACLLHKLFQSKSQSPFRLLRQLLLRWKLIVIVVRLGILYVGGHEVDRQTQGFVQDLDLLKELTICLATCLANSWVVASVPCAWLLTLVQNCVFVVLLDLGFLISNRLFESRTGFLVSLLIECNTSLAIGRPDT